MLYTFIIRETAEIRTDQFLHWDIGDPAEGFIQKGEGPIQIHLIVAILDALEDGAVLLLALSQGMFGHEFVSHIPGISLDPRASAFIIDQMVPVLQVALFPLPVNQGNDTLA